MADGIRAVPRTGRPASVLEWGVVVGVLAFLAIVVVFPLSALVAEVAAHPGEVWKGLATEEALHALRLSCWLAAISVLVNGVVGVVGALVLVRQRFLGRRLLDAMVDLPLAVSPVMTGLGFLLLFGRNGILGPALGAADVDVAFAFPGLVIATLFVSLPFTIREVALVLEELGTSEEQAAATLGANPWTTFWRVTLPNIRHGLTLGLTLTTARSLGEFGAVLVLGGAIANKTDTATTFIHGAIEERHGPAGYGMALLLAALAIALLAFLQRIKQRPALKVS